jgi:ADP-ribosylglycohydrolase
MLGRDADSTSTTVGSWVGALHGESGLPVAWVDKVCEVNRDEIDIRGLAEQLVDAVASGER